MTRFKKGFQFRHNANDVEIINRHDNLVLARITPDFAQAFFDISTIKLDGSGGEHFDPSYFGNGLTETLPGAPKVPKSLEEMRLQFDNLVAAAMKREISAAEARDAAIRRELEFVDRKRKGQEVKDRTKVINDELRQLAIEARDMKDFASDKKVQKLAHELSLLDIYKSNI